MAIQAVAAVVDTTRADTTADIEAVYITVGMAATAGLSWRAAGEHDHLIAIGKQTSSEGLAHEPAAASQNDPFGSHSEG